jgi:hypothetical protein
MSVPYQKKKVGDGQRSLFWKDRWLNGHAVDESWPRWVWTSLNGAPLDAVGGDGALCGSFLYIGASPESPSLTAPAPPSGWIPGFPHYGRTDVCRRPGYVPTAKCRGRRHRGLQLPATKLTVGTAGPSAQRTVHRRPPSAQPRPSAQLGGARRSPSAHLQPSVHALTGGPSR